MYQQLLSPWERVPGGGEHPLKPISRARLAHALDRVRALSPGGSPTNLDHALRGTTAAPARFLVKNAGHYLVVGEARVICFSSEDGLTRMTAEGGQYWMDPTLNELEARLDPARFFRISRAAMISLNAVAEIFPMPGGSGEVLLKNGQRLEVSRRRFRELLEALGC